MASFASSATPGGARKHAWTKRKRERAKVGDNNGQATHGARKHAWRTQVAWAHNNSKGEKNSVWHFKRRKVPWCFSLLAINLNGSGTN